ncbi:hypothetical protein THRCLA_22652 [Thraustotheca clavata]|uniref:Uncharacterized protein n=1 Tax=Thraustotheca clavata TaxID=74557 RepID=A0A1V9YV17_9STRA|nr:hypothetical protein THRCLA_22652 [Thraustotheca clavata]
MYFYSYNQDKTGVNTITLHYYHTAAMENLWLDELDDFLKYPIALANAAVAGGHLRLLHYLVANYFIEPIRLNYIRSQHNNGFLMDIVSKIGNLDLIKYFHAIGSKSCTTKAIDNAARYGHFDTIKWLHQNRTEGWTSAALLYAIDIGHLDIVKYLAQHRHDLIHESTMLKAVEKCNLEVIKLFHEDYHIECTPSSIELSLFSDLEIAKYCIKRCTQRYFSYKLDGAAKCGVLVIIKLLHENHAEGR